MVANSGFLCGCFLLLVFVSTSSSVRVRVRVIPTVSPPLLLRRLASGASSLALALAVVGTTGSGSRPFTPPSAHAAAQVVVDPNDVSRLKRGLAEINYLLKNWEDKTTYCNFGEFKNELLSAENKDKLLEAAKEPILLYDKSATMKVKCKKDPEVVRAFLGLTKENLLMSQADVLMRKQATVDMVDPDDVDSYFEAVDLYEQATGDAGSLAYQARRDFSSTENFTREELTERAGTGLSGRSDYLTQAKSQVEIVAQALAVVVKALKL